MKPRLRYDTAMGVWRCGTSSDPDPRVAFYKWQFSLLCPFTSSEVANENNRGGEDCKNLPGLKPTVAEPHWLWKLFN